MPADDMNSGDDVIDGLAQRHATFPMPEADGLQLQ